jgi:proline dehydrogenase
MKRVGEPVRKVNNDLMNDIKKANLPATTTKSSIDFSDTEIAFARKSDQELKETAWLFRMMNQSWLVNIGSKLGVTAVKWKLPFAKAAVERTIFQQFCGGTTLLRSKETIQELYDYNVASVLDYGAEAKDTEEDFNIIMNEIIRGLEFAANNESVPVVVCKLSGMARNELLEKVSSGASLTDAEEEEFRNVRKRVESICHVAKRDNTALFFDAEESWIQGAIDGLVQNMMERYNEEKVYIYGTYQMYLSASLDKLKRDYQRGQEKGYMIGAKLVRGAYMNKERERAAELGYPSPVQADKAATDRDFNEAVRFCVERYQTLASCNASHNQESCQLQADLIVQNNLPKDHAHLNFCQLLGMSDHLTFNLGKAGFNVAKYLVYGPVEEVLPYLVRRAEENASVTGDMSRELALIERELDRRGL